MGAAPDTRAAGVLAAVRIALAGPDLDAGPPALRSAVLVEGLSDQAAVLTLATRRRRDLRGEGVAVVAMGGATNLGHFLDVLGPRGLDTGLAGLCDAAEEPGFRRALDRAGLGRDLAARGFFVCTADLEDELIRALGGAGTEQVVTAQGELRSLRTFQKQPAQRDRPLEQQLRRFLGTRSGRKIQYGRALVEALDLAAVPAPLERLLAAT